MLVHTLASRRLVTQSQWKLCHCLSETPASSKCKNVLITRPCKSTLIQRFDRLKSSGAYGALVPMPQNCICARPLWKTHSKIAHANRSLIVSCILFKASETKERLLCANTMLDICSNLSFDDGSLDFEFLPTHWIKNYFKDPKTGKYHHPTHPVQRGPSLTHALTYKMYFQGSKQALGLSCVFSQRIVASVYRGATTLRSITSRCAEGCGTDT